MPMRPEEQRLWETLSYFVHLVQALRTACIGRLGRAGYVLRKLYGQHVSSMDPAGAVYIGLYALTSKFARDHEGWDQPAVQQHQRLPPGWVALGGIHIFADFTNSTSLHNDSCILLSMTNETAKLQHGTDAILRNNEVKWCSLEAYTLWQAINTDLSRVSTNTDLNIDADRITDTDLIITPLWPTNRIAKDFERDRQCKRTVMEDWTAEFYYGTEGVLRNGMVEWCAVGEEAEWLSK